MITDKQLEFLSAMETNLGIISIACDVAGVDRLELESWMDNLEFAKRLDFIRDKSVDYVEHQLLKLINNGDLQAIQFYLKTKGKKRGY